MDEKLRTLVVDGDPMSLDKASRFARKSGILNVVKECINSAEALEYMSENPVDVIFTEISMPGADNGIEFIESLPSRPIVIIVTAQREYALDAFRLGAVDYLLKPYGMADFQRAVERIKDACMRRSRPCGPDAAAPDHIFIRNGKEYDKVSLADIIYISGDAEYLAFHVSGYDKPLREKSSFAAIARMLTADFVQIHRSSMINLRHVSRVGKSYVVMDDDTLVRVSDGNRDRFYSKIAASTVGKNTAR